MGCGSAAESVDVGSQVGLAVEPGPGHACCAGDVCERDRLAGGVEAL